MGLDGYGLRWLSDDYRKALNSQRESTLPAVQYAYVCQRPRITDKEAQDPQCVLGASNADPPTAILWGDSNAAHYIGMIAVFAAQEGFRFRNLTVGSCPPLYGEVGAFVPANRQPDCIASQPVARSVVDEFPVVIISSSWLAYQKSSADFLPRFFETVRSLTRRGKLVILIGKAPVIDGYDRRCTAKALSYPFLRCPMGRAPLLPAVLAINARLKSFADREPNVKYFDLTRYLCNRDGCMVFDSDGTPLYYDSNHFSMPGSWRVGRDVLIQQHGVPEPFAAIPLWAAEHRLHANYFFRASTAKCNPKFIRPRSHCHIGCAPASPNNRFSLEELAMR